MACFLTSTSITVLSSSSLKHPPSTADPAYALASRQSCISWCAESGTILLGSAHGSLSLYEVASGAYQELSVASRSAKEPIASLLYKDRGATAIFAQGQQVVVLSVTTGKPANTFDTHKSPVTSLSLSNDSSLLASTSAHAIHVHNLTLASHTVLRGIPSGGGSITTCAFHPHSRTRLLVGLGSQLLVYDTTRPSGPVKVIDIDKEKKNIGSVIAISCSPFSKTLVAVGCSGGTVALVDLEKEKGLFRVVPMPAPITCLSFSAEGAAVYAGTENGKFLVLDLRALDKPPKTVTISENGDRITAISVQKKLKAGEAVTKPAASTTASKPLVQRDVNKAAAPPASAPNGPVKKALDKDIGKAPPKVTRPRAGTGTTNGTGTSTTPRRLTARTASSPTVANPPANRVASGSKAPVRAGPKSPVATRPAGAAASRRAFSPTKSPVTLADKKDEGADVGDLSVRIENLLQMPKPKELNGPAAVDEVPQAAASRASSVLSRASSRSLASNSGRARMQQEAESPSHAPTTESISTAAPRARTSSSASTTSRVSKASVRSTLGKSPVSPVRAQPRRISGSTLSRSRTPSPELPDINDAGPVTPIPAYKMKGKERAGAAAGGALGLGTPDVDEWIRAGEAKEGPREGKRVGFAANSDGEEDEEEEDARDAGRSRSPSKGLRWEHETEHGLSSEREHRPQQQPELAMQISPRRSFPGPGAPNASRWAPVPSPLRNPASSSAGVGGVPGPVPASPQARAAQDMLQALLRDALHDFRAETKAEIVGLHLDLIRMGTSWRREMQDALGGIGEELRALREENARLRDENERLRRGY
ncbi:WD40 repeat-like protein [Trametes coccinea BRFM310]|uniref:WD40 repeat-like protein n=1 Tax=Trametes coccinea (strain BRFM310) TaxID=1353009 RepID=A0A1Y2J576_TRAC3|nr:WD40 repeat-like protein [Trametes coccinea BRFM310]